MVDMAKRMKLPKDGLIQPEERDSSRFIGSDDVEGHGLPTTAPPVGFDRRGPGHGGENASVRRLTDDGDDVEGHRQR